MRLPGTGMSWKEFFTSLKTEWSEHRIGDTAGALTYAGVLSLFPFLLCLVALASLVMAPQRAESIIQQAGKIAPPAATQLLADRIEALIRAQSGTLFGLSLLGAIWAASGGMNVLIRAMNVVYGAREGRPFWKVRGLAVLMTLATAALAIVALLVAVFAPVAGQAIGGPIEPLFTYARFPVAAFLMMLLWALLYWALPDVERRFRFFTPGSIIGVAIWLLASWGFSQYVQHFGSYEKTYGTLGGIIVLLVWMGISAQVLLLGAEINAILEHRSQAEAGRDTRPHGRRIRPRREPAPA